MISGLETAGFFVAITLALRFSSWAERWITSPAEHVDKRASMRGTSLHASPIASQARVRSDSDSTPVG